MKKPDARVLLVSAALCALLVLPALAAEPAKAKAAYEMVTYQLALLAPAPDAKPLGEREIQAIQEGHLRYLRDLFEEGKALIEGPLHGVSPFRSVIVLDVPSTEEARAVLGKDPWVVAGQLVPEVHPWFAANGILHRPRRIERNTLCYLGLLRRPSDAPSYPDEKLQEIQKGHLDNIRMMADSRDLVLAGPLGDDTPLRGILLFRTTDPDRIRALVAQDPAVKAGRLGMDLYPWYVPEGIIPD